MKTSLSPTNWLPFAGGLFLFAQALSAQALYTAGHGDFGFGEGGTVEPHVHLHAGATVDGLALGGDTEYDPGDVIIFVPDTTYDYIQNNVGGRPAGAAWDPIGVNAGESFWFLPETGGSAPGSADSMGAPFFGIGGEEIDLGAFDSSVFTLTLKGAALPAGGDFSLWTGSLSPTFSMSTVDGISDADTLSLDLGTSGHMHANWGFTAPGLYELDFEVSALQGSATVTASATYSFLVSVPEPSSAAALFGLVALSLSFFRRRR